MPGLSKVIVLEPDVRAGRQLQLGFEREGIPSAMAKLDGALEIPPDAGVVVVGGVNGAALDLVRRARAASAAPIVFAGRGVARADAEDAGAHEVVRQPAYLRDVVTISRLLRGRTAAQRDHMVGNLVDLAGVLTLVRALAAMGRSATLTLVRGLRRGEIRFFQGEVTSAQVGMIHGRAALHQLLLWTDARFDFQHEDLVRRQQIPLSHDELFADAERFLESVRESSGGLSPSMVLEQDLPRVQSFGKHIPTEVYGVLRMFDGYRVLADVLEDSAYRVFETLRVAQRAVEIGLLRVAERAPLRTSWRSVVGLEDWLIGQEAREAAADSGPVASRDSGAITVRERKVARKTKKKAKRREVPALGAALSAQDIDWGALVPREVGAEVGTLSGMVPAAHISGEIMTIRDAAMPAVDEDGPKVVLDDGGKAIAEKKAAEEQAAAEKRAAEERAAAEKAAAEKAAAEKAAAEKAAAEKAAAEKAAAERAAAAEKAAAEKAAAEKREAEEKRAAEEKAVAEMKAAEENQAAEAKAAAEKAAEEKAAAEKAAAEKAAAEKAAAEKAAAEKAAAEKAAAEKAAADDDKDDGARSGFSAVEDSGVIRLIALSRQAGDSGELEAGAINEEMDLHDTKPARAGRRKVTHTEGIAVDETDTEMLIMRDEVTVDDSHPTTSHVTATPVLEVVAMPRATTPVPNDGAPGELSDEPSDGVIVDTIATAQTAQVRRRRMPSVPPEDDRPEDAMGEITAPRPRPTEPPSRPSEPSVLIADLAAVQAVVGEIASEQVTAPANRHAASATQDQAIEAMREDAVAFSELEEAFFRRGHEHEKATADIESFDDLDVGYQPLGFWDRLRGRKRRPPTNDDRDAPTQRVSALGSAAPTSAAAKPASTTPTSTAATSPSTAKRAPEPTAATTAPAAAVARDEAAPPPSAAPSSAAPRATLAAKPSEPEPAAAKPAKPNRAETSGRAQTVRPEPKATKSKSKKSRKR